MKQWIVVFTLSNEFRIFRLVDDPPDTKTLRYASIVYEATEVNSACVVKDRYGMFNPSIHPVVSNSVIHMFIAEKLDTPDGMGILLKDRK